MIEQVGEFAQGFDNRASGIREDMLRVNENRGQTGALCTNDVGVVVVAYVEGGVGFGVRASHGLFEYHEIGFVGIDFTRGENEVKIVSNSQDFEFFQARPGAVGDDAKGIAFFLQGSEGSMGIRGERIDWVVFFRHNGADLRGQYLSLGFFTPIGTEIAIGIVLPKFRSDSAILCEIFFGDLVNIRPITVRPSQGIHTVGREVVDTKLNGKIEEGMMRGRIIVTEGTVEVEEDGFYMTIERKGSCTVFIFHSEPSRR